MHINHSIYQYHNIKANKIQEKYLVYENNFILCKKHVTYSFREVLLAA